MANYTVWSARCNGTRDVPESSNPDESTAKRLADEKHSEYPLLEDSDPNVKYYYVKDPNDNLIYVRETGRN